MRRVRLCFTLVGKSNWWERGLSKELVSKFDNEYRLDAIRARVADQFGDRALLVINDAKLQNDLSKYPDFYAAGWFVSQDDQGTSELVLVEHGSTMEAAQKAMLEAVKTIDWDYHSVEVEML